MSEYWYSSFKLDYKTNNDNNITNSDFKSYCEIL